MVTEPAPLFGGRLLRIGAGAICLYFAYAVFPVPIQGGELIGSLALLLLGASLVLGGVLAQPGCEITVLPNLLFKKRWSFF